MVDALVLMPPPDDPKVQRQCLPETLGLIGFHAVHKTVSRPQWIWTSFEHVKNVPDKDEVAANKLDGPYSFFSVDCGDRCPVVNATPPRPWDPDPKLAVEVQKRRLVQEPDRPRNAADQCGQEYEHDLPEHAARTASGKTTCCSARSGQALLPARRCTAQKPECAGAEDRFRQAARHDLFAGADLPGQFHARDLQPGRCPTRFLELYRLSRQRCRLSTKRVESAGRQGEPEPIGFHIHAGEGAVRPDRAGAVHGFLQRAGSNGRISMDHRRKHNDRGASRSRTCQRGLAARRGRRNGGDDRDRGSSASR